MISNLQGAVRVAVVHNSLSPAGGAERLCMAVIEALKERGYHVTLATFEPTDWGKVERVWGGITRPDEEVTMLPFRVNTLGIYMRLASSMLIPRLRGRYDIVINTHGDSIIADADITYMHFPSIALWEDLHSKYAGGFWRLYFAPYYLIQKSRMRRVLRTILLTNSRFSAAFIRRYTGRRALVVYPPVDLRFSPGELEASRREDVIVSIGRFSPEKRHEVVVEIASRLPEYEFHIAGSTSSRASVEYYNKIRRMVEERGLRNVHLHPNIPQRRLEELLLKAKVYLHAMPNEHFGIAVVEGMNAGLVPVVFKSGGPWFDIVERGRYGLGYSNVGEAVEKIRYAVRNYERLYRLAYRRSQDFSKERFKERITRIVDTYAEYLVRRKLL